MVLKRVRFGSFTFAVHFAKITQVTGVLSRRGDGSHFLMWEFDAVSLATVKKSLKEAQRHFHLPDIYVASSGRGDHYHAYCFKPVSFADWVRIVGFTPNIDLRFLRWTLYRGEATLRFYPKVDRTVEWIARLPGRVENPPFPKGGWRFVQYETVWPGWG